MFSVFAPGSAQGAMPETLNYQGRMRLTSGAAVADSNSNNIEFRLYDDPTAGTLVWSETQSGVTTTAGLFNVQLGVVNPLSGLPFNQPYWLTLRFNGDSEMNPRTPLAAGPYAFRAKAADALNLPYSANAATPGTLFGANNTDSVGTALRGQGSGTSSSSTGVLGQGGRGVVGASNASGGVGVLAQQGSGDHALVVSGNARVDWGTTNFLSGTQVDFNPGSSIDFTGATVSGLPGVSAPLSLTLNSAAAAPIYAYNSLGAALQLSASGAASPALGVFADGHHAITAETWAVGTWAGVRGLARGDAAYGVQGESEWPNGRAGVFGSGGSSYPVGVPGLAGVVGAADSVANGVGVFGAGQDYGLIGRGNVGVAAHGTQFGVTVTATGAGATGVIANVSSSNYAVRAINNGSGYGLLATGMTGVAGVAPFANAIGVLASSNGQANALALKVSGPASFSGNVDFSAATVSGLPTTQPPVSWLTPSASPVLSVENTGTGLGLLAKGVTVGISATATDVNFGRAIYAHTNPGGAGDITTAEFRRSGNGTGAALRAYNTGTAGGAPGIQASSSGSLGVAVNGLVDAVGNTGYGIRGENSGSGNLGAGVYGENGGTSNTGYGVYGANWPNIGVYGLGRYGVVGRSNNSNGAGVLADWNTMAGSLALKVSGPARFDMGSVTFASHVDFSGATVTGLALNVVAPLALTESSATATVYAMNTAGGNALYGRAINGGANAAVYGFRGGVAGHTGIGVLGEVSGTALSGAVAIKAKDHSPNAGTYAFMAESYNGVAVSATASGSTGLGGYFTAITAVVAEGRTRGLSASASAANGVGVYGGNHSGTSGYGVYGYNYSFSGGAGVRGEANSNFGIGVLAQNYALGGVALKVTGNAQFFGSTTFTTHVDFSGATVTGLVSGVVAPLSLTLNSAAASPLSVSNASGAAALFQGLTGVVISGSGLALSVTSQASAFPAVMVRGSTFSHLAQFSNDSGGSGLAAYSSGGSGIFAQSSVGDGVQSSSFGAGMSGVRGIAGVAGAYGVYAQNLNGGTGLYVTGGARVYGPTTFTGQVDFSGATVTGLSLPVTLPISGSAPVGYPGAVIEATNTGSGQGIKGTTSLPGGQTGQINFNAFLTAGIEGYSAVSLSAGVIGRNASTSSETAGVIGLGSSGTGVYGISFGANGHGGSFESTSGTGAYAKGLTGVVAEGQGLGSLALKAKGYNLGELALQVEGRSQMSASNNGFALSVTQSSSQFGAGAIMAYSAASGTAAIRALNTNTSGMGMNSIPGVGVWAEGTIGIAAFSTHNEGMGIYAQAGPATTSAAIRAEQSGGGFAIEAEANSGVAIYARGVTGLAAFSYASGGTALFAYGSLSGKALVIDGNSRFNSPSSSAQTQFFGQVDFSGATVTGLAGGGANPMYLVNSGTPPVIEAVAQGANGTAIRGSINEEFGQALDGIANSPNSRALRAIGNNGADGAYVQTSGGGIGVLISANGNRALEAVANNPFGQAAYFRQDGWAGTAVEASANTQFAIAVKGVAFYDDGIGVRAENFAGGKALDVLGGSYFAGSTTFTGNVDFSGAVVTGLSGGVSVPLNLSGTVPSPIIQATNFFPNSVAIQGENMNGTGDIGVMGRVSGTGSNNAAGVLGAMSNTTFIPFGGAGVVGDGGEASHGVYGRSNRGDRAAIFAQQSSNTAGSMGLLAVNEAVSSEPVFGIVGSLQNTPFMFSPLTPTAIYGWGNSWGTGIWGATHRNEASAIVGQHRNVGVGGVAIRGEAPGSNGIGILGVQEHDFDVDSMQPYVINSGVVGVGRGWNGFGVAALASGNAKAALYGRHVENGMGLLVEGGGALAGAIYGLTNTSANFVQVTALAVSATVEGPGVEQHALGLSVTAEGTLMGTLRATGAVVQARSTWSATGLSVNAQTIGPAVQQGYGLWVESNRVGAMIRAVDDFGDTPAGTALKAEGIRYGVHAVAKKRMPFPPFGGVGVAAESAYVALSAVAMPDGTSNSGLAFYARGRQAADLKAEHFDTAGPVVGAVLEAYNTNSFAMVGGAVGLSVNARSDYNQSSVFGISVTASIPNFGNGQVYGIVSHADNGSNGTGMGFGIVGSTSRDGAGVHGIANGNANGTAGVRAENRNVSMAGAPTAALDLVGGISYDDFRTNGGWPDKPAGRINIGNNNNGGQAVVNYQVKNNSVVILTMDDPGAPGGGASVWVSQVNNPTPGQFVINWQGWSGNNKWVNYFIINPR